MPASSTDTVVCDASTDVQSEAQRGGMDSPIRVLRLTNTIGPQSSPYNQFSLALSDRHSITICNYFPTDVSPPREITLLTANGSLFQYIRLLKNALTKQEYDVAHAHTPQAGILFLAVGLLFRKRVHRTVYTVHTTYEHIKFRNRLLLIPVFTFFRHIVCCGQASIESMPTFFRWLAGDRLSAIQNGVDLERIGRARDRNTKRPGQGSFTIAAVGRIIGIKDPLSLLHAFQLSKPEQSELVFIGEGDLAGQVKQKSNDLGLGRQVTLPGLIPREEVYEHLFHADVFVSTSLVEGLPVAVLEAMACGCPVILSDIPSHREIAAGTNVIPLVPTGDAVGFAREICRFRDLSHSERVGVGEQCRQLVEQRFDLRKMHNQYEEVYTRAGR